MKQLLSIAAILLMLLIGCSKDVNITVLFKIKRYENNAKVIKQFYALVAPEEVSWSIQLQFQM